MAAGDDLIDEDGNDKLDADGNDLLDDGGGNDCDCGCGGGEPATTCCEVCTKCCFGDTSSLTVEWEITGITAGCAGLTNAPTSGTIETVGTFCASGNSMNWGSSLTEDVPPSIIAGGGVFSIDLCGAVSGTPWTISISGADGSFWQTGWISGAENDDFPDNVDGLYGDLIDGDCCGASGTAMVGLYGAPGQPPGRNTGDGDARCAATITFTITVNNNRCCRCTGGDCTPTSDGSLGSGCEETDDCTALQDDDCGVFP